MRGTTVGYSKNTSTGVQRAFASYNDGTMYDLFSKVNNPTGWTLQAAEAINANGWIAGWGYKNGTPRAFMLAPNFQEPGRKLGSTGDPPVPVGDSPNGRPRRFLPIGQSLLAP